MKIEKVVVIGKFAIELLGSTPILTGLTLTATGILLTGIPLSKWLIAKAL